VSQALIGGGVLRGRVQRCVRCSGRSVRSRVMLWAHTRIFTNGNLRQTNQRRLSISGQQSMSAISQCVMSHTYQHHHHHHHHHHYTFLHALLITLTMYCSSQWRGARVHVPRRSWKFFQSIIGLWTVRDLWRSMALFSRIFIMCLQLMEASPPVPTGALPLDSPGDVRPPDLLFCPPVANSWPRPWQQ